jgi:dihydroorotase
MRYHFVLFIAASCLLGSLRLGAALRPAARNGFVIDPATTSTGTAMSRSPTARSPPSRRASIRPKPSVSMTLPGLFVTPGLIDLHAHVFNTTLIAGAWAGDLSVQADSLSSRTGVTTLVDAGSSGWRNFETFRHTVIDRAKTRVLASINIAGFGMITDITEQKDFSPEEVARLAKKHSDVVVGVKSAHYRARTGTRWRTR